jgi:hypothetical protein
MGQYYKPVCTDTMEWLYSHNYDNGLKLMEHSYVGNSFVGAVMSLMTKGGKWCKKRIVWAGDYYDEEGETGYYGMVKDRDKLMPNSMSKAKQKKAFLLNHTKKEYVDYSKVIIGRWQWRINPLPLLTACGNGRGGGDYYEDNPDFDKVGIWANDVLSISFVKPKDHKELIVKFHEE